MLCRARSTHRASAPTGTDADTGTEPKRRLIFTNVIHPHRLHDKLSTLFAVTAKTAYTLDLER